MSAKSGMRALLEGEDFAPVKCILKAPPPSSLDCCPFLGGGFVVGNLLFNMLPIDCGGSVFFSGWYA